MTMQTLRILFFLSLNKDSTLFNVYRKTKIRISFFIDKLYLHNPYKPDTGVSPPIFRFAYTPNAYSVISIYIRNISSKFRNNPLPHMYNKQILSYILQKAI